MPAKADLHMHSGYSLDGEFSVSELISKCRVQKLETISLTDHNSVKGVGEAISLSYSEGISVIPGIEIDCVYKGTDLHVLGYNIKWDSGDFLSLEEDVNHRIMQAFPEMLRLLKKAGIRVDADEVIALANGRPPCAEQIAEVLVTNSEYHSNPLLTPYLQGGSRSDMPYINFYHDYFAQGKEAYVKIDFMTYKEAIDLIRSQEGIPVVAHPGVNLRHKEAMINDLLDNGALGLEAFNNYHDEDQISYFAGIAEKRDLLMTCGSDFHGKNKPLIKPGVFKQVSRFEDMVNKSIRVLLKQVNC
jgi:predicted metal-dependent phosphoesterase TrpH